MTEIEEALPLAPDEGAVKILDNPQFPALSGVLQSRKAVIQIVSHRQFSARIRFFWISSSLKILSISGCRVL